MSNYPDGVTGNEPQIAGSDEREIRADAGCDFCNFAGEVLVTEWVDGSMIRTEWTCPDCNEINAGERDDEPEYDDRED